MIVYVHFLLLFDMSIKTPCMMFVCHSSPSRGAIWHPEPVLRTPLAITARCHIQVGEYHIDHIRPALPIVQGWMDIVDLDGWI